MWRKTLPLLALPLVATPAPWAGEQALKDSDHKKLGKEVAAYFEALNEDKGIGDAFADLQEQVDKLQKKLTPFGIQLDLALFNLDLRFALNDSDPSQPAVKSWFSDRIVGYSSVASGGIVDYIFSGSWWITAIPGVVLVVLVLVINLLGDWMRDVLNPKLYKG